MVCSSATWILCSVIAVVAMAVEPVPATPEVKDAPAGAHYGAAPSNPGYGPSFSAPQYPVFQFPNFDVNYCSVHASFPLVGLERRHHHRGSRSKRQSYGVQSQDTPAPSAYGSSPSFDAPSPAAFIPRPRPFDRQGCRNTAVFSRKSCHSCCQVASRANGNTNAVVGILMTFDPKLSADKKHKKDEEMNSPDRALQCVCCTKRV